MNERVLLEPEQDGFLEALALLLGSLKELPSICFGCAGYARERRYVLLTDLRRLSNARSCARAACKPHALVC